MASTPSEFFAEKKVQLQSNPGALGNLNALYQFNIEGDNGGKWIIEIRPDNKDVREGEDANPQCAITMSASDFMSMIKGSLNPQMAFMTGKLRVKGDMGLALKLQAVLN